MEIDMILFDVLTTSAGFLHFSIDNIASTSEFFVLSVWPASHRALCYLYFPQKLLTTSRKLGKKRFFSFFHIEN